MPLCVLLGRCRVGDFHSSNGILRLTTVCSGYQIALTGSIIANKGFIAQYGTALNSAGDVILDADILAAWGGIQSAGQGVGMLTQHL